MYVTTHLSGWHSQSAVWFWSLQQWWLHSGWEAAAVILLCILCGRTWSQELHTEINVISAKMHSVELAAASHLAWRASSPDSAPLCVILCIILFLSPLSISKHHEEQCWLQPFQFYLTWLGKTFCCVSDPSVLHTDNHQSLLCTSCYIQKSNLLTKTFILLNNSKTW